MFNNINPYSDFYRRNEKWIKMSSGYKKRKIVKFLIILFGSALLFIFIHNYITMSNTILEKNLYIKEMKIEIENLKTEVEEKQKIIDEKTEEYRKLITPAGSGEQKSYMDYRAITDTGSPQYHLSREAKTDDNGLMYIDDEYYCIALGSAYGEKIGTKYKIQLSNGKWFKGILTDQKSDLHTDSTKTVAGDGSVVEFVVNGEYLNDSIKFHGDVSVLQEFNGSIESIEVMVS